MKCAFIINAELLYREWRRRAERERESLELFGGVH